MPNLPQKMPNFAKQRPDRQQAAEANANFGKMLERARQDWADHQARMKGRGGK